MWELAKHLFITKGKGEAVYKLNSFDFALIDARIANYNHSIQSSIIPPHCKLHFEKDLRLPAEGSILPTIYSRKHGILGETICAGLAFATNDDLSLPGLVYEVSGVDEKQVILDLRLMLQNAAEARTWKIRDIYFETSSLVVTQPHGCVLVAAVLLP